MQSNSSEKPKKKHNWMAGFVIPPAETPEARIARERAARCRAIWDGNNKHRLPKR